MEKQVIEDENIGTFKWDETSEESVEFFGVKPEDTNKEVLTEAEKEALKKTETDGLQEDKTKGDEEDTSKKEPGDKKPDSKKETDEVETEEEKKKKEEEEEKEKLPEPFAEEGKEGEEGKSKSEVDQEQDDEFFKKLALGLKETGILSVDVPDENINEEAFVDLQEKEIQSRVDETIDAFLEEMDDDGRAFLKFKKEGGDTKKFFDVLKNVSAEPQGNIEDEDYQKAIIIHYEQTMLETDKEEIDEKLKFYEESGRLQQRAETAETKLKEFKLKETKRIEQESINARKQKEEAKDKFKKQMKDNIEKTDEIKGFPIVKTEKPALLKYITNPSVKVSGNKYMTEFQRDLKKVSENPEEFILLAKLIKSGFDISTATDKKITNNTLNLKKELSNLGETRKPSKGKSGARKSLSEYF